MKGSLAVRLYKRCCVGASRAGVTIKDFLGVCCYEVTLLSRCLGTSAFI